MRARQLLPALELSTRGSTGIATHLDVTTAYSGEVYILLPVQPTLHVSATGPWGAGLAARRPARRFSRRGLAVAQRQRKSTIALAPYVAITARTARSPALAS